MRYLGNLKVPMRDTLGEQRRLNYLPAIQKVCKAVNQTAQLAVGLAAASLFGKSIL